MEEDLMYNAWVILESLDRAAGGEVGVAVNLPEAVEATGTEYYGPDYNDAVEFLIQEDAIEERGRGAEIASGDHPGGTLYWAMTATGKALLQELRRRYG